MDLFEAMRTTFAAREYTGEDLPDDVLYEILDNARFAPSGGNRQGNRVVVVRDAATRRALSDIAAPAAKRYAAQRAAGESPWNPLAPPGVSDAEIARTDVPPHLREPAINAPVVLVFAVDLGAVAATDQYLDRIAVVPGGSIYPFVWNVLLCARALGYGGTITTLAVSREPELKALLHIPDHFAVAAIVPLGRPVRQLSRLKRRPVAAIATRERFDGAPLTRD